MGSRRHKRIHPDDTQCRNGVRFSRKAYGPWYNGERKVICDACSMQLQRDREKGLVQENGDINDRVPRHIPRIMWYMVVVAVIGAATITSFPDLQPWVPWDQITKVVGMTFLIVSAGRLLHNKGKPIFLMPLWYGVSVTVNVVAWLIGALKAPSDWVIGPMLPAFFLSIASVPGSYLWDLIKPIPRTDRFDFSRRRAIAAAAAALKSNNNKQT